MNKNLLDLSGKISEVFIDVYDVVDSISNELNIPFCVIGATARDLILSKGYGQDIRRGTLDIDLAVSVPDWEMFEELSSRLIATGKFIPSSSVQRLLYEGDEHLPLDIVPFGFNEKSSQISWPPNHEVTMSILGFEEAMESSLKVRLRSEPNLDISVVSPAGLTMLKLVAWSDRRSQNNKDAIDLNYLMKTYMDAGNRDRLYGKESDLLDDDFDYVRSGARLLGRDVARLSTPKIKQVLLVILNDGRLAEDMMKGNHVDAFDEKILLLEALKKGVEET